MSDANYNQKRSQGFAQGFNSGGGGDLTKAVMGLFGSSEDDQKKQNLKNILNKRRASLSGSDEESSPASDPTQEV